MPVFVPVFVPIDAFYLLPVTGVEMSFSVPVFLCLYPLFSSSNWSRDACLCTCFYFCAPSFFQ